MLPSVRRALAVAGSAAALGAIWPCAGPAAADPPAETQIGFMNGVYEDLGSNLEPIRQGSLVIRVSSPEHRLTVHGNRLRLTPRGDGTFAASMEVDFEGGGHLIADVEGVGRFEDLVAAPRQTARATGAVRIARSAGGYLLTVEAADPFVRLEIVSGVSRQVAGACRALSLIPFVELPCGGLEAALSTVRVPMPAAGKQFEVPAADLSAEEKAFFDQVVGDRVAGDRVAGDRVAGVDPGIDE